MKPKIICHIMGSVDGRILVDRWSTPPGGTPLTDILKIYSEAGASLNTDAWTFGKNTVTEIFPERFLSAGDTRTTGAERIHTVTRTSRRMFISIDPEADIKYTAASLRGDDILAVVGRNASDDYLAFLRGMGIAYIIADDISDLADMFETINREFGITSVSLQGGGTLNGGMLEQGMIDELSYVIYPGIDGTADSVSIFNCAGGGARSPMDGQCLELLSAEKKEHGAVWLRYRIRKA